MMDFELSCLSEADQKVLQASVALQHQSFVEGLISVRQHN